MTRLIFVLGSLVLAAPGIALADEARLVDCALAGATIEGEVHRAPVDRPVVVVIRGTCVQDVTVKRDDVMLVGETGAAVHGTIAIVGARRVAIRQLMVTGPGAGVVGTDNAAFTVQDSFLERNATDGITVRNGAHATLRRNSISYNGQEAVIDRGRGIDVRHGGSVDASNNTILNNRSDGVGVFNGSYARLTENTIEGNGRRSAGEAGIQVNRSRVRAHGNTVANNTGISALIVVNHSDYRTGSGLNTADFPDNEFPFERIAHPVGQHEGQTLLALDVNNSSYGDFRQVHIVGSIVVGDQSMMQLRGDQVPPNLPCSTVDTTGGVFFVSGRNGVLRLRAVNVTPGVINLGVPNAQRDGGTVCPLP
jgi:hypothetical protein